MNATSVSISRLQQVGRWRVEMFLVDENLSARNCKWDLVPLGSLCEEIAEAVDPPHDGIGEFVYVGLENVESITGDTIGKIKKVFGGVKSRSKEFQCGDVLYGRLRPNLRKVWEAVAIDRGLCSTEFIILRPNQNVSAPVLRAMLASEVISSQLARLQTGAALPRVSSKDLLSLKVPAPDRDTQKLIEIALQKLAGDRELAKGVLARAATDLEELIRNAIG